jgi:hypothetical protein
MLSGGQRQKDYRDFVDRYERGNPSEGYSDKEVLERYSDVSHSHCRKSATGGAFVSNLGLLKGRVSASGH